MTGGSGPAWPPNIQPIEVEQLGRLGIDSQDQIYWDGRRVEVRQRLSLSGWQRVAAALVTLFAVLGGLGALASGLTDSAVFLCARNLHWLSCPAPPR